MATKPLSEGELVDMINPDTSDIEFLSDDDDGWEAESTEENDVNGLAADEEMAGNITEHQFMEEEVEEAKGVIEAEPTREDENRLQNEIDAGETGDRTGKAARKRRNYDDNELTEKPDIKWMKYVTYKTSVIQWYEPKKDVVIDLESPLYFFRQYFTHHLSNLMVVNTNLYVTQENMRFAATNIGEIEGFIGMHILMGNLHYPRVRCYWENRLRISMICDAMPRDRFHKIRTALHFVNVQEKPLNCTDRMWKVRPIYDTLREHMRSLDLESELSIDEQMIPFKGKLNIKQYVKGKPSPWGIKLSALCGTSGLMYDFIIYQGAITELNPEQQEVFGLGASIVLKLSERIQEINIQLYFDNFFSNYNLLQYLRNLHIYASGTVRVDFHKPPFSSDSEMKVRSRTLGGAPES